MTPAQFISERLQTLMPESLSIRDESHLHIGHQEAKNGAHLRLHIVSTQFTGMSLQARHRLIYQTIGDLTAADIHALAVVASAPGETTKETL